MSALAPRPVFAWLEMRLHGDLSSLRRRRPLRLPPRSGSGSMPSFGAPPDGFRTSSRKGGSDDDWTDREERG